MLINKLTFNFRIRSLQLINHILMVVGLYYASQFNQLHLLWLSLFFYVCYMPGGVVVCLHRLLTHKSFKTSKFWEYALSIFSVYGTVGSTITWVALHRLHHKATEKSNDPHSPFIGRGPGETLKFSYWQAFKSWVGIWDIVNIPPSYSMDLVHSPFHVAIHRNYFKIIFATCFALALINPWLVLFVYIIPACGTLHATSVINILGHAHGYRLYETKDRSTNTWIGSLVTLGDGWHNTHHAKPNRYHYRDKWWEIDPCGDFINLIKQD